MFSFSNLFQKKQKPPVSPAGSAKKVERIKSNAQQAEEDQYQQDYAAVIASLSALEVDIRNYDQDLAAHVANFLVLARGANSRPSLDEVQKFKQQIEGHFIVCKEELRKKWENIKDELRRLADSLTRDEQLQSELNTFLVQGAANEDITLARLEAANNLAIRVRENHHAYMRLLDDFTALVKEITTSELTDSDLFRDVTYYLTNNLKGEKSNRPTNKDVESFLEDKKNEFCKQQKVLAEELTKIKTSLGELLIPHCDRELKKEIEEFCATESKREEPGVPLVKASDVATAKNKLHEAEAKYATYMQAVVKFEGYIIGLREVYATYNPNNYSRHDNIQKIVQYSEKARAFGEGIKHSQKTTMEIAHFLDDPENQEAYIAINKAAVKSNISQLTMRAKQVHGADSKPVKWLQEALIPNGNEAKKEPAQEAKDEQPIIHPIKSIRDQTRTILQDLQQNVLSIEPTKDLITKVAKANTELDDFNREVNRFKDLASLNFGGSNSTGLSDILALSDKPMSSKAYVDKLYKIAESRLYPWGGCCIGAIRRAYRTSAIFFNGRKTEVGQLYQLLVNELGDKNLTVAQLTEKLKTINAFTEKHNGKFVFLANTRKRGSSKHKHYPEAIEPPTSPPKVHL